ncbi:hypothetical protein DEU56DRAFT_981658 [Suillus clintonianus]|uniref:uncharacterized protein n=1 Tax=Suillus clintonianus TaxID=1904413 RepID=UPI001B8722CC|nr:uncharacterized protein DEU56DRAFT_981658 [Suillus clintonianus]KAG2132779.1 hypothetical protein DEU56DRAFT_981658 [Suillus clintonianus]
MVTADIDTPALISTAQTEIDNELLALQDRMRQNSLSPISSIPPEILGDIFVHLAQQTQLLYAPDNPAVLSWLNVGHICRHWREVALGTPELWSAPYLNSSQATEEMLMRSKMAPLKLRTGQRYRMDCVQKALMHIERLQEVSLPFLNGGVTYRCIMEFLNKLSSCSAPQLQSLSLQEEFERTLRIAIPTSFLAPNLRNLQIKCCDLSWASSVLTGLTVLDIKRLSPECLPTLDELISALRRMPALHTLELEDALPTLPLQTTSLPRAPRAMNVRLPHLKRLRLVATFLEMANVLARIELPESTILEVHLRCRVSSFWSANQEWNLSLPVISRALKSCFKDTPAKSQRVLLAFGHIHVRYSTIRNPASWARSIIDTRLDDTRLDSEWAAECPVVLDFGFLSEMGTAILSDLWQLVPLGNLEALCIEGSFVCWDGFWTDLLGRGAARNLTYINLRGPPQALKHLLKSLRSRKHSVSRSIGGHSQQGPIFSPALSHLVLHNLEFDSSSANLIRPSDLLDVLIDRVNGGRGLDRLEIIETSGIFARDVQLLQEVVADVSWDEYEHYENYDFEFDHDSFDDDYSF